MKTKKTPLAGGAGKEYINTLNSLYSTLPRRNCKNCCSLTHCPLCSSCDRWRININAVQQVVMVMREGGI